MNIRDIFTLVIAATGAGYLLHPGNAVRRWGYAVAAIWLAAVQWITAGPHWQMLPAFVAMTIVIVMLFRGEVPLTRKRAVGMVMALGLVATSALLIWVLPTFQLPEPTGDFYVGTRTEYWKDSSTGRELVAQVWYPVDRDSEYLPARYVRMKEVKPLFAYWWGVRTNSEDDAPVRDGAHPLILFGPMWGGRRTQDTFLAEELASHGYVVVAVDHPGNAGRVEMSDGRVMKSTMAGALSSVEASSAGAIEALWAKELAVWMSDDEFVLDRLAATDWLSGKLDLQRVGALGHSFGGAASMALLGVDTRVKCAVNLDGWTFNAIEKRTREPVMFVYEGSAEARRPAKGVTGQLDSDDNAGVDASLKRFGGYRAYVAGTQHLDFTDQTLVSPLQRLTYTGPIKGQRVRTILRAMVVGFFDETLKRQGKVAGLPEVRMEHWPGQ